ncbi:GntR family transcriptional regulator [Bradyrhizobium canariense]|uniref:Transcriptional regulator, GntR family n=1 Tax=Bradyrhizobium canariense TaxID=255045 RepID=A0A1H1PPI7_9BRAD|nr:GntR family transcriptional regulator [Bradyrhizobium canariense]SDS13231.1 transcriptional regulator, GntR family [Bradyrhizobium canariense]
MARMLEGVEEALMEDQPSRVPETPRPASIVERLRRALIERDFEPGERLNELHLSRRYATSRTPIRAALHMLAGEGLLDYAVNRGFRVRPFALSDIVDAYDMRALAEGMAARLAAERGLSQIVRNKLERALESGNAALSSEAGLDAQRAAYAEMNEVFHTTIHEAAASALIHDVVRLCHRVPQAIAGNVTVFDLEDARARHAQHHRIYELILCREAAEAEALMRAHVASVKAGIVRAYTRKDTAKS